MGIWRPLAEELAQWPETIELLGSKRLKGLGVSWLKGQSPCVVLGWAGPVAHSSSDLSELLLSHLQVSLVT